MKTFQLQSVNAPGEPGPTGWFDGRAISTAGAGAAAAMSVTIPHAVGLGLLAFGPLADEWPSSAMALWSAAVPGALMTLLVRSRGVIYAPSTAVALLFGGMLALVMKTGDPLGITASQALAITGVFVAFAFLLQWLMAVSGMVRLSRFVPISVMQGFAAGVGLSLVLGQLSGLWQQSGAAVGPLLAWQVGVVAAVVLLSLVLQRLWPAFPALLLAVVVVSVGWAIWTPLPTLPMSSASSAFLLPQLPDWWGAPWQAVLQEQGFQLASLALLMSVVNTMEVSVFHQQLESEYGVRHSVASALGREAMVAMACAVLGMIPASSSTSRSRTALSYTRQASLGPGQGHALGLIIVAGTGHLWLGHVPIAVLVGALLVAGVRMIPASMWPWNAAGQPWTSALQSWFVSLVFVASSGAMALLAGLIVAMVELLRASGSHAIRRMHLEGKWRSRHVRRAQVEAWLAPRMRQVAVFELQGIVSFGVAALVVEHVREHLQDHHRCVILDASRAPSWDETGCQRIRVMARELQERGIVFILSGVRGWGHGDSAGLAMHEDLDRAIEWAEDQILSDCPQALMVSDPPQSLLGDLGAELDGASRLALEQFLQPHAFGPNQTIIRQGDLERTLLLVQCGTVALSTSERPQSGLRLSVIGAGSVFGEMAFLNGIPRTAYAHAGEQGAEVAALAWDDFQRWSEAHPKAALAFVTALARMGIRRLGATSQELRAAME